MSDGNAPPSNVGTYLARRLINIGIREFYAVPGKSCLWLGVHSSGGPGLWERAYVPQGRRVEERVGVRNLLLH